MDVLSDCCRQRNEIEGGQDDMPIAYTDDHPFGCLEHRPMVASQRLSDPSCLTI
jgi:hypothetical protein